VKRIKVLSIFLVLAFAVMQFPINTLVSVASENVELSEEVVFLESMNDLQPGWNDDTTKWNLSQVGVNNPSNGNTLTVVSDKGRGGTSALKLVKGSSASAFIRRRLSISNEEINIGDCVKAGVWFYLEDGATLSNFNNNGVQLNVYANTSTGYAFARTLLKNSASPVTAKGLSSLLTTNYMNEKIGAGVTDSYGNIATSFESSPVSDGIHERWMYLETDYFYLPNDEVQTLSTGGWANLTGLQLEIKYGGNDANDSGTVYIDDIAIIKKVQTKETVFCDDVTQNYGWASSAVGAGNTMEMDKTYGNGEDSNIKFTVGGENSASTRLNYIPVNIKSRIKHGDMIKVGVRVHLESDVQMPESNAIMLDVFPNTTLNYPFARSVIRASGSGRKYLGDVLTSSDTIGRIGTGVTSKYEEGKITAYSWTADEEGWIDLETEYFYIPKTTYINNLDEKSDVNSLTIQLKMQRPTEGTIRFDNITIERLSSEIISQSIPQVSKEDFHLYLCIGQSNMAGRAPITEVEQAEDLTDVYLLNDYDKWEDAAFGNDKYYMTKNVMSGFNRYSTMETTDKQNLYSPVSVFAQNMKAQNPQASIGIISNAVGGTTVNQWQKGNSSSYYFETVRRTKEAMKYGTLKGILWHQGEGNAWEHGVDGYMNSLKTLVADLKTDLGIEDLPFIVGGISTDMDVQNGTTYYEQINSILETVQKEIPYTAFVSSQGLHTLGDNLHFDTASQKELGQRYAESMLEILKDTSDVNIMSISREDGTIYVRYSARKVFEFDATLIVVAYDGQGSSLNGVQMISIENGDIHVPINMDPISMDDIENCTLKAFVWSMNSLQPISKSKAE